ncbi:hypothetical protein CMI42_02885 [Candidatus Pacearchaeota archaeon]|nr:hypothetical protein [Candidatus Pacearchaeota archaeon]|tara:strand:+ start:244 stop:684 length:441 start_codon:yes stop_codon:yes gene_type:complete
MINENIVTSLRNAVNKGESIESAKQIMLNSGYNPEEVEEASHFMGGVSQSLNVRPEEQLTMPGKKGVLDKQANNGVRSQNIRLPSQLENQQQVVQPLNQASTVNPAVPVKKKSHKTEIILGFVLVVLIVILIFSYIFRNSILGLLS